MLDTARNQPMRTCAAASGFSALIFGTAKERACGFDVEVRDARRAHVHRDQQNDTDRNAQSRCARTTTLRSRAGRRDRAMASIITLEKSRREHAQSLHGGRPCRLDGWHDPMRRRGAENNRSSPRALAIACIASSWSSAVVAGSANTPTRRRPGIQQDFKALAIELGGKNCDARDVAAWTRERGH